MFGILAKICQYSTYGGYCFYEEINNNHNGSGMAIKYRLVGQVQGVGFRHYLLEKAQAQGITGWGAKRMRWQFNRASCRQ